MNQSTINAVSAEIKYMTPFEWLCVGKPSNAHDNHATVMINQRDGDIIDIAFEPIFYRTIDLRTQRTVDLFIHPKLSVDAGLALAEHYSEQQVLYSALMQLREFVTSHHRHVNANGESIMPMSERFGKNIYHTDVEELRLAGDQFINV